MKYRIYSTIQETGATEQVGKDLTEQEVTSFLKKQEEAVDSSKDWDFYLIYSSDDTDCSEPLCGAEWLLEVEHVRAHRAETPQQLQD